MNKGGDLKISSHKWVVWMVIIAVIMTLMMFRERPETHICPLTYNEFITKVENNQIAAGTVIFNPQSPELKEITGVKEGTPAPSNLPLQKISNTTPENNKIIGLHTGVAPPFNPIAKISLNFGDVLKPRSKLGAIVGISLSSKASQDKKLADAQSATSVNEGNGQGVKGARPAISNQPEKAKNNSEEGTAEKAKNGQIQGSIRASGLGNSFGKVFTILALLASSSFSVLGGDPSSQISNSHPNILLSVIPVLALGIFGSWFRKGKKDAVAAVSNKESTSME